MTVIVKLTIQEIFLKISKSHEWKGVIDLGGQLDEVNKKGEVQTATKALVFMIFEISGAYKSPVAYYFSNSLTGEKKSILLKELLVKLHEKGLEIIGTTFDGDESNQKACTLLGVNFDFTDKEHFKPFLSHPSTSEPVYVFFDPCHMLKLVRN